MNLGGDNNNPTLDSAMETSNVLRDERKKKLMKFKNFNNDGAYNVRKSQLDLYLEEPRLNCEDHLNILTFWKSNQYRYPEVAAMARDILCIPVSTVASESAFSVGGRVLDQYRSALKPDVVEAIICTRDWLFGEKYNQELKIEDLTEDVMHLDIKDGVAPLLPYSSGSTSKVGGER